MSDRTKKLSSRNPEIPYLELKDVSVKKSVAESLGVGLRDEAAGGRGDG